MKVIIAGSRYFTDYQKLKKECDQLLQNQKNIVIVSGDHYKGADKLGIQYANEKGFNLIKFPAEWNKFGKAAGPIRNKQMVNYADVLIAFWDRKSKGTASIIRFAKNKGLLVYIYYY